MDLWPVYQSVFGDQPDFETWRDTVWDRHRARDGFRLVGEYDAGALIGFAYGYTGRNGQWWTDNARRALPPETADAWLDGHFELVSLGVVPTARRSGLGRALLRAVLDGLPHDRLLLMTTADATDPARCLYASEGWQILGPGIGDDTVIMGKRQSDVLVIDYDPAWPDRATTAIDELRPVLRGVVSEIEHIGSTAVPGLAAKPVIDLMAAAGSLGLVEERENELAERGYHRHHNGMTDRLLYVRSAGKRRTHILHVVTLDTWPTRNQRLLRDYLREHPRDVERYSRLKRALAADGVHSRDYARAKTELIQELTDRARAERGLPSVPVWEK